LVLSKKGQKNQNQTGVAAAKAAAGRGGKNKDPPRHTQCAQTARNLKNPTTKTKKHPHLLIL
jgi:hypothetical protein